jgi:hypothetical protein
MSRRTGVVDFLSDIADDIKDFVDDEILDRGRRAERDLRRAGRNVVDQDGRPRRRDDLQDLRVAIRGLARQIQELARDADPAGAPVGRYRRRFDRADVRSGRHRRRGGRRRAGHRRHGAEHG